MSDYAVVFQRGFFGTFLIYFINQHNGFTKGESVPNKKHFNTLVEGDSPRHLNMPKHSYYYKPLMGNVDNFKGQVELLDWEDFRASHKSESVAFKPVPHHYDMMSKEYVEHLQERSNLIICTFEHGKERVIERIRNNSTDTLDAETYVNTKNKEAKELAQKYGGLLLDMGKLIDCDIRSYGILCDYIKVEPLFLWQDLVTKHKELIGFE